MKNKTFNSVVYEIWELSVDGTAEWKSVGPRPKALIHYWHRKLQVARLSYTHMTAFFEAYSTRPGFISVLSIPIDWFQFNSTYSQKDQ